MKRISFKYGLLSLLGSLFFLTACGPSEISEKKMEGIIRDLTLVNSYYSVFKPQGVNADSVDFYTPVLKKYGHDIKDFRYTLDRWALKKSTRLTDLLNAATAGIQKENVFFQEQEVYQRRIDTMLNERYLDTLMFHPESQSIRSLKDRKKLVYRLAAPAGLYHIHFGYVLSPEDRNNYIPMRYYVKDSLDSTKDLGTRTIARREQKNYMNLSFSVAPGADSLELIVADFPGTAKEIFFRFDSLLITYNEPIEKLRKRFVRDMIRLEYGIEFPYELEYKIPTDSGALHVMPPFRLDSTGGSEF